MENKQNSSDAPPTYQGPPPTPGYAPGYPPGYPQPEGYPQQPQYAQYTNAPGQELSPQYPPKEYETSYPQQQAPAYPPQQHQATQPPPAQIQAPQFGDRGRDFQRGLCVSCDTPTNTICGFCCAPFYHVYLMDKGLDGYQVTDGLLWLLLQYLVGPCVFPIHQAQNREKLRAQYGLEPQDFLHDYLLAWCCGACATCQEGAEINYHQRLNQMPGGK